VSCIPFELFKIIVVTANILIKLAMKYTITISARLLG
jgi:hypothetical protein